MCAMCFLERDTRQEHCTCMTNAQPLRGHTKIEIGQKP